MIRFMLQLPSQRSIKLLLKVLWSFQKQHSQKLSQFCRRVNAFSSSQTGIFGFCPQLNR